MADIITIGDDMVIMSPATNGPMRLVNSFIRKPSGAELNSAVLKIIDISDQVNYNTRCKKDMHH